MKFLKNISDRFNPGYKYIADKELSIHSKNNHFRKLTNKEKIAVDIQDFRDISNQNPNNHFLITCEHASNNIHNYNIGNQKNFLNTHWGYDIGAKEMGLELSQKAKLLSIYSNFSRLILDPNRSLLSQTLIRRYVEKNIELEFNKKGIIS